jgi:hypothetical protein
LRPPRRCPEPHRGRGLWAGRRIKIKIKIRIKIKIKAKNKGRIEIKEKMRSPCGQALFAVRNARDSEGSPRKGVIRPGHSCGRRG